MPQRLPFELPEQIDDHSGGVAGAQCPIHNLLSPELRDAAEEAPHLMAYLHKVPFAEFGVPDYYPEANRKMGDIEGPQPHLPRRRTTPSSTSFPTPPRRGTTTSPSSRAPTTSAT